MPSLKEMLSTKNNSVQSGSIRKDLGQGVYEVEIDGSVQQVRSAVPASLQVGKQVVVVGTRSGNFIIGHEKSRGRKVQEVIIPG
jgi:membrane protein implicated in regulation of membrane protease activity